MHVTTTYLSLCLGNINHQQLQHSCRHCSSPCLHRTNTPFLPVPSLLSSSASSSSNSSSSPSSPSQIYLKTHPQSTNCNGTEDIIKSFNDSSTSKFILPQPPSYSTITTKDNLQLCESLSTSTNSKYPSITSTCSTMVTPTASLLSSVTTTTLTPSNLYAGKHLLFIETHHHHPHFLRSSNFLRPMYKTSLSTDIILESTIIFIIRCIKYSHNIYR
jgi:hypothetical protein